MRKKLIIILTGIILTIVLAASLFIIESLESNNEGKEIVYDFDFYPENYDENIFDDAEYMSLNHIISYKSGPLTISVNPEEYASVDPVLDFLTKLIETMKNGDFEAYESYFSDEYRQKNLLPEKFTMQRIYNVTIEKISEGRRSNGEAQLVYMLDFMINKNNGSLRSDIDSDSSKPWYLTITTDNEQYKIDNILTYNQK